MDELEIFEALHRQINIREWANINEVYLANAILVILNVLIHERKKRI